MKTQKQALKMVKDYSKIKPNKIYITMSTQKNNNRTEKKVLILIAIFMGIFIVGASIQIFSNL